MVHDDGDEEDLDGAAAAGARDRGAWAWRVVGRGAWADGERWRARTSVFGCSHAPRCPDVTRPPSRLLARHPRALP
eukprot:9363-Prymnesium_polylepis.1